jgi:hypothetical protein
MSRIAELEKKLGWDIPEAPPPVQAPRPEDLRLTLQERSRKIRPREARVGFVRHVGERIVGMGFIRRIGERIDRNACKMKLRVMRDLRAIELLHRGLTEDQAGKQAGAEILQFAEMWGLDLSSLVDIRWAEENFPIYTRMLDSTPPGGRGEGSTRSTNSEPISRGHDSDPQGD